MIYSIIIAACLVCCLCLYFVLSRRYRTPTITTEVLVNKYNAKIKKLERFLRKNKVGIEAEDLKSHIEKSDISMEKIGHNIDVISKIEDNNELIEEIFIANTYKEVEEKLAKLNKECVLYQFQSELVWDDKALKLFQMMGFPSSKLDFEQQRYFGSQNFFRIENKMIFASNSLALVVDPKNIFDCIFSEIKIITEKISKKGEKNAPNYEIFIKIGRFEHRMTLQVPQKELRSFLDKFKKGSA